VDTEVRNLQKILQRLPGDKKCVKDCMMSPVLQLNKSHLVFRKMKQYFSMD